MTEGSTATANGRPSKKPDECGSLASAANRVSWLKVIVASSVALLAAGAAAALYAGQFATSEETTAAMEKHEAGDGHPSLKRELQGVGDRLIRVETVQQRMEQTQERMEDKIDRILDTVRVQPSLPPGWPGRPTP